MNDKQPMRSRPTLHPVSTTVAAVALALVAGACGTPSAKPQLDAAEAAVREARAERASDCAPGLIQAAEAALAEARQLESAGDADAAKKKAASAATLGRAGQGGVPARL